MPGFLSNIALAKTYEHYNVLSSLVGDTKDRSVLQFINGIQDAGLWDNVICWPLRKDQNVGTGTLAYGIGGLGSFNGDLMSGASWEDDGLGSSSCSSGYLRINDGVGLLSAEQITSGAVFTSSNSLTGDLNYLYYWIYGNQVGETINIEYGGSFKEAPGKGIINNMRSAELSGAFDTSNTSKGSFQFLVNVTVTELLNNSKTFLNGVLKTTKTVPVYSYLSNEDYSLSSINLENDLPLMVEGVEPLNGTLMMCQDGITPLLLQDSSEILIPQSESLISLILLCQDGVTPLLLQDSSEIFIEPPSEIFIESPSEILLNNSYQIGKVVVPPGSEWNWDQTRCITWNSMKSIGSNPLTWNIEPNTGVMAFHFIMRDTALNNNAIASLYQLYRTTMGKNYSFT